MALGLLGLRLFLAVIFGAAVAGKVRNLSGVGRALVGFGVPASASTLAAPLIPALEFTVAALLVPATSAWWGAAIGLGLLVIFTMAIGLNLARGRTPDCPCFGVAAPAPIGPAMLARNGALGVCAVLLLVNGAGTGLDSVVTAWDVAPAGERFLVSLELALLGALLILLWHGEQLRHAHARLRTHADTIERQLRTLSAGSVHAGAGLSIGAQAPPFTLPRLEGDRASLDTLRQDGLPILLVFSSAHCPACAHLWPDISRWQREQRQRLTVAVVCSGPPQTIEVKLMGIEVRNVLLQSDTAVSDAYQLSTTPSALLVGADGRIDSDSVEGVPAIRALVEARIGR